MVAGIDSFRDKFRGFEDCYTVIGGAACDILMSEADIDFRLTKDIDMILILEDKKEEFAKTFWEYIKEESYTSKADFLAKDYIPVYKKNSSGNYFFSGKRIQRGLYRHYDGTITNADINGAANILRKVFPKVSQWDRGIVDMPCSAGCIEHCAGSCRSAA